MKKRKAGIWCLFFALYLFQMNLLQVQAEPNWPGGMEIAGETAIVMDTSTKTILYEKNAYAQYYPASITKIMTALLAIENCSMDEYVVFSKDAIYKTEGSGISRDVNEVMTMEECLYGLMLESANECAYAIAEHVGGDYETFIRMMNERAAEIGCQHTHFNNPHGLPDENHYICAYDMALIASQALESELFRQIIGTKSYKIPPTNKHEEETPLRNSHKMINPYDTAQYLYEGCIGGKTGYTDAAGNTLVTFARRNGMTVVCVVLKERAGIQYQDTIALLDNCFEQFQACRIGENEKYYTSDRIQRELSTEEGELLFLNPDDYIVLPKGAAFSDASVTLVKDNKETERAGFLEYTYGDRQVGKTEIVLCREEREVTETEAEEASEHTQTEPDKKAAKQHLFPAIVLGIILFGAGFFAWRFTERK